MADSEVVEADGSRDSSAAVDVGRGSGGADQGSLSDAVARVAGRLTGTQVEVLARYLDSVAVSARGSASVDAASPASFAAEAQARALVPTAHFRREVQVLWRAWREVPRVPAASVAFGLRAAFAAIAGERASEHVELVATGPRTRLVPLRSSEAVLLDLIGRATRRLLIVSFATFRVPVVREALVAALDRGVAVTMLMEDAELGELRSGNAYADLAPRVRMLAWPAAQRGDGGPTRPKMHAKAAVVDGSVAFITSANLTGAGLEHNMELGTLISGGDVADTLERHVGELLRSGVLAVVG